MQYDENEVDIFAPCAMDSKAAICNVKG